MLVLGRSAGAGASDWLTLWSMDQGEGGAGLPSGGVEMGLTHDEYEEMLDRLALMSGWMRELYAAYLDEVDA